ncbi:uncharacterized protein LOC126267629 [Schistocerca gregaria]|uniref:uncharacterized protein LOC126267629 n=1 Tax=Schistocerca gregaria TaxID=7010 RepID=UPI00211E3F9F|nr:uncharacterized protein LOC126267629 [Schistocerca gregaria]
MTRHVQSDERPRHSAAAAAASAARVTTAVSWRPPGREVAAAVAFDARLHHCAPSYCVSCGGGDGGVCASERRRTPESLRRCRSALAVLLVAAAALLPATHAAPAAAPAAHKADDWIDPCGIYRDAPGVLNMKNVKKVLRVFRNYLHGTFNSVKKEWDRASSVYEGLKEIEMDMEWLPRNQYNHYKDTIQGLTLPEKPAHVLQHVHDGVQKYLATVAWLQRDAASSLLLHKDLATRAHFLSEIRSKLKSLQCAAQKAIVDSKVRLQVQRPQLEEVVDAVRHRQPSQGTPQLLLRDRTYLTLLKAFLADWQKVVGEVLKEVTRDLKKKSKQPKKDATRGAKSKNTTAAPRRQRHKRRKEQQRRQQA